MCESAIEKALGVFVAVVLVNWHVQALADERCRRFHAEGNCDFYVQCVEAKIPCGPEGYALSFGEKYCRRFNDNSNQLDAEGQKWVRNVTHCLMQALVNLEVLAEEEGGTRCQKLLMAALNSHHSCYINHDFCMVIHSWKNVYELVKIIDWTDFLPGYGSRLMSMLWYQIFRLLGSCALSESSYLLDTLLLQPG